MASGENFEFSKDRSTKKVRFNDSNTDGAIDMAVDLEPKSNCRTGSMVNGIPAINFSERFNQLLIKDMATTVLVDIENRYFLVKFQNKDDFEKVLSQGPWIIYGQYLIVQSWTTDFNLMQPYPSVVKAWIRLSSLSDFFYKHRILEECNTSYPRPLP
ncbi:hypothetical protein Goshw_019685, partial [Gossypium schwendimanii]|nr:hypothetical protein [Gossypium schwendimanii]